MTLTKEDLQAIESLFSGRFEQIDNQFKQIDDQFKQVNKKIDVIQGDVAALKADMAHHNHTVEPQLKIIREGLEGWSERSRQIDRHEIKLENHGDRILALEYAFKTK